MARLQSAVALSGVVTAVGVGPVGVDEMVVVVSRYVQLCASPSYQVTGERNTRGRHAAPPLGVTPETCKQKGPKTNNEEDISLSDGI
jgi:hypothetical protein